MILCNLDSYKLHSGTYKCLSKHLSSWCTMTQSIPWQLDLSMSENNRPPQNSHCWTLPIKGLSLLIFPLLQKSELKHILLGTFSGISVPNVSFLDTQKHPIFYQNIHFHITVDQKRHYVKRYYIFIALSFCSEYPVHALCIHSRSYEDVLWFYR